MPSKNPLLLLEDEDRELLAELVDLYLCDPENPREGGWMPRYSLAWDELVAAELVERSAFEAHVGDDGEMRDVDERERHVRPTKKGIAYAKRWRERDRRRTRDAEPKP